jgi:hypothetical protein
MRWRPLLSLAGCTAVPPQPGERFSARVFVTVTLDQLRPDSAAANALQQGATLDDVWDRRLVSVTCVVSPNVRSQQVYDQLRPRPIPRRAVGWDCAHGHCTPSA